MAIQAHLPGGGFLLGASDPQAVYAPEDFTDEHHLLAHTIREFITQEVLPRTVAIDIIFTGICRSTIETLPFWRKIETRNRA